MRSYPISDFYYGRQVNTLQAVSVCGGMFELMFLNNFGTIGKRITVTVLLLFMYLIFGSFI